MRTKITEITKSLGIKSLEIKSKNRRIFYSFCSLCVIVGLLFTAACKQDMADQPRYDPLEKSTFFADNKASRPMVEGTVARGQLRDDTHLYTGMENGKLATTFPYPITEETMKRGQERFNIYCAPCHDRTGSGEGLIVQRGFRKPPSFHIERLRNEPVGHFYDVISNGFGAMASYSGQVNVRDRWAIAAYIRALQASQPVAPTPTGLAGSTSTTSTTPATAPTATPAPTASPAPTSSPATGAPAATGKPAGNSGLGATTGNTAGTGGQHK